MTFLRILFFDFILYIYIEYILKYVIWHGFFPLFLQEKFKREFNKRFAACFCKFQTNLEPHERTFSMHTRASSIRSTYANSSMRIRSNFFGARNGATLGVGAAGGGKATGLFINRNGYPSNGNGNGAAAGNNGAGNGHSSSNSSSYNNNGHQTVVTFAGSGGMPPWRRNNFKPLHPNVVECEDDMALMELPSTSEELPPSIAGAGVQLALLKAESRESSSCICEQEFGSRIECDGTCILSEVSRVQQPPTKRKTPENEALWQPL